MAPTYMPVDTRQYIAPQAYIPVEHRAPAPMEPLMYVPCPGWYPASMIQPIVQPVVQPVVQQVVQPMTPYGYYPMPRHYWF
jgi:hypothetical protein